MPNIDTSRTAVGICPRRCLDISVVIVTWNSHRFVAECLASLGEAKGNFEMEILVVDNDSCDGTGELIEREFPKVRLIRSGGNLGFAKGNNVGMSFCKGKYISLINPDVSVPPECVGRLWEYMETHPDVGLIGPQLLERSGEPGRSTMRFLTLWNLFCRAMALDRISGHSRILAGYLMHEWRPDKPVDVDVLNGWFWMVRSEALAEVGVLDRRFFMYGEDIDWSHRFHQAGWRVVLYPGAQATHYGGGSSEQEPIRFSIERERANLQYWRKFHGPVSTLAYRVVCSANCLIRVVGYTALTVLSRQKRPSAVLKRKKSAACLRWLVTLDSKHVEV